MKTRYIEYMPKFAAIFVE